MLTLTNHLTPTPSATIFQLQTGHNKPNSTKNEPTNIQSTDIEMNDFQTANTPNNLHTDKNNRLQKRASQKNCDYSGRNRTHYDRLANQINYQTKLMNGIRFKLRDDRKQRHILIVPIGTVHLN